MKRFISIILSAAMVFGTMTTLMLQTAMAADSATVVRLEPSDASPFNNGEFQGWGTSMGWWGNRVGHSDKMAQQAAEVFYGEDGLGLDIVRYNLGGGDQPGHNHITRSDSKLPTFAVPELNDDNTPKKDSEGKFIYTYNWDADHDQMNVLTRIKTANPDVHIEGYTNSPPWFMTNTLCSGGGTVHLDSNNKVTSIDENLSPDNYDDFAEYVTEVTKHFKEIGLEFDSYSPMNEPNPAAKYWGELSGKQEGNHVAQGEHQSGLINAISAAYDAENIDTLVVGMDETDIDYSINSFNALTDTAKANLDRLDTHTYGGSNRAGLKAAAIAGGKNLWMSEVDGNWNGLGLADRIITDLNGMQASAWVLWDIVDFHKDSTFQDPSGNYTEKDASLNVTGSMWGMAMGNHDTEEIELANKYYYYGQFTRYINPGDTIIASSGSTLAAYNKTSGDIKIVALNSGSADRPYVFDLGAFTNVGDTVNVIRTNNLTGANAEHWAEITEGTTLENKKITTTLKSGTVTTFVVEGDGPADYMTISGATTTVVGVDYNYTVTRGSSSTAPTVTWSVSDPDVADITQDGKVTAKKGGSFAITVTAEDGASSSLDVKALDAEQTIRIVNKNSGKGLETSGKSITSGSQLVQWDDRGIDTAAWKLQATTDNHFNIINANADMLLVSNSEQKPAISGSAEATDDNAKWDLINHGDYYEIKNVAVGKSLNVSGQSTANGGNVILYTFGGGDNELWSFSEIAGDLEHVVPVVVNYADKYKDSDYIWVKNIDAATNDFSESLKGFVTTGFAGIGTDSSGEPVLLPQNSLSNNSSTQRAGTATLTLEDPITIDAAVDEFEATAEGVSYKYTLPEAIDDYDQYFAIYDASGALKTVTKNESEKTIEGDFTGATYKLLVWNDLKPLDYNEVINLSFEMYTPNSLGDSTFDLTSSDGSEIVKIVANDWGNIYSVTIGDEDVETAGNGAVYFKNNQSDKVKDSNISNGGHVEIYYTPATGFVKVTIKNVTGSAALKTYTGVVAKNLDFGKIYFAGEYTQWNKTMVVDNLVTNVVISKKGFDIVEEPEEPKETDAPILPASGELINMSFDNGDLASTSTYGKAAGSPKFVTVDEKECIQFDGTNATAVTLTDANGNPLLTGQKNLTISFKVKPTTTDTSWWIYAAPNAADQTYRSEHYIGALTNGGKITAERYNSSTQDRPTQASGTCAVNTWNDVLISIGDDMTSVYVNGTLVGSAASTVDISDMLGKKSVAYIGLANWEGGQYATGYLDDFVIYNYAFDKALSTLDLGDTSDVKENLTLPATVGDTNITWTTSDEHVITNTGIITRGDDTQSATLTASAVVNGVTLTKTFDITVTGYAEVLNSFAAYSEDGSIKFSSDWTSDEEYNMSVTYVSEGSELVSLGQIDNTASGTFASVANGTYKVTATLKNKTAGEAVKSVTRTVIVKTEQEMGAYLFAHFVGNESAANMEQIYFSVSEDGTTWTTLNSKSPVLTSTVGEKGVRDPYILRGENGKFYIIATDLSIYELNKTQGSNKWGYCQTNGSKNIVVWSSEDLINWSAASTVEVGVDNAGCVWAPEAVYDAEEGKYMVFWASKISDDNYGKQRMYRSYTEDFVNFTEPEIYIDNQSSAIDTTIIQDKGMYYRFTKDETHSAVTMMKSASLSGGWKDVDTYTINGAAGNSVTGYEGPTIYKLNGTDDWCLLLDFYSQSKGYKPFVTHDITKGAFTSAADFTFDATYRHGTVMPITTAEYNALLEAYGNN